MCTMSVNAVNRCLIPLFSCSSLKTLESRMSQNQYKFTWYFDGAIGINNSPLKEPGYIVFNKPGTFEIKLLATNEQGENDPTPDNRTITVKQLTTVTAKDDTSSGALQPMWLLIFIGLLLYRYGLVRNRFAIKFQFGTQI